MSPFRVYGDAREYRRVGAGEGAEALDTDTSIPSYSEWHIIGIVINILLQFIVRRIAFKLTDFPLDVDLPFKRFQRPANSRVIDLAVIPSKSLQRWRPMLNDHVGDGK